MENQVLFCCCCAINDFQSRWSSTWQPAEQEGGKRCNLTHFSDCPEFFHRGLSEVQITPALYDIKQLAHFKLLWWPLKQEWERLTIRTKLRLFCTPVYIELFCCSKLKMKAFWNNLSVKLGVKILLSNSGKGSYFPCNYILVVKYVIKSVSVILGHPQEQKD